MIDGHLELSIHVVRTTGAEGEVFFHTVTKESLPVDADPERLRSGYFLKGQEAEAIERGLFRPRRKLALTLVVTWACNLRCTHCNVIDRLEKKTLRSLDPQKLRGFISRYLIAQPTVEEVSLAFLGGEPLLAPEGCQAIMEATDSLPVDVRYHMTTNLAVVLGEAEMAVLKKLDRISVSIDGPPEAHNAQRIPLVAGEDPYLRTMGNLRELVEAGLADRVHVQAAVPDAYANPESMAAFYRELISAGIHAKRATYGTIHPTHKWPEATQTYLQSRADPVLRPRPCCKFRGGSNLIVGDDDHLYSDFHDWEELGRLEDPIDSLLERHQAMTRTRMPALKDPKCRVCPALGLCWGGCVDGSPVYGERPSDYCDQEEMKETLRIRAKEGSLIGVAD